MSSVSSPKSELAISFVSGVLVAIPSLAVPPPTDNSLFIRLLSSTGWLIVEEFFFFNGFTIDVLPENISSESSESVSPNKSSIADFDLAAENFFKSIYRHNKPREKKNEKKKKLIILDQRM